MRPWLSTLPGESFVSSRAGAASTAYLIGSPGLPRARGRIERLLEASAAVEGRRSPQPIDLPDLLGDRDPPLLAHLLLDELHRKERRQILRSDRLAGAGMKRRGQRGLEVGLDVVPLRRDVLLVEEKLGVVAGLSRHALPPSDLVAAGPREKCANDTQGGPPLSIQASARLLSQEGMPWPGRCACRAPTGP